jgi:hypothetical protein
MQDWGDALCEALDAQEKSLAAACHLKPGMDAEEFEENLGLLLRWEQVRHLEEMFKGLGGNRANSWTNHVTQARTNMDRRMRTVMETVNSTLYALFGQRRVDDQRAESAYGNLLRELDEPDLVVATTNYDRAAEAALQSLGRQVDTGFRGPPERTRTLQPTGIVADRESTTPVLHLHGAVGWYEREGTVEDHYGDLPYNASLGTPVILYPDPDKDPTSDAFVSLLWAEFRAALDEADAVLALGHSLNDRALVQELSRAAESKKVAITFFSAGGAPRVKEVVADADPIQLDFGPEIEVDRRALAKLATV